MKPRWGSWHGVRNKGKTSTAPDLMVNSNNSSLSTFWMWNKSRFNLCCTNPVTTAVLKDRSVNRAVARWQGRHCCPQPAQVRVPLGTEFWVCTRGLLLYKKKPSGASAWGGPIFYNRIKVQKCKAHLSNSTCSHKRSVANMQVMKRLQSLHPQHCNTSPGLEWILHWTRYLWPCEKYLDLFFGKFEPESGPDTMLCAVKTETDCAAFF